MLHALPFADVSRLLHVFVGPSISSLVLCLAHIAYKQDMSINGSFDAIYTGIYRLRSCSAFSLHGNTLPWNTMMGVTSCEQSIATFSRNMSTYLGNPTNRSLRQFFLRTPPPQPPPPSCHGTLVVVVNHSVRTHCNRRLLPNRWPMLKDIQVTMRFHRWQPSSQRSP